MSDKDLPPAIAAAMESFGNALINAGRILAVQAAAAWTYQGDLEQARAALQPLPVEALQQLSASASALSSLADEVAASKS